MNRLLLLTPILLIAGCKESVTMNNASVAEVAAKAQDVQNLKAGQWEGTAEIVEMTMAGMPGPAGKGIAGGKTSFSNCVTEEQAKKPAAGFFQGKDSGDCRYDSFEMKGGKINAAMTCSPAGRPGMLKTVVAGTYSSTEYAIDSTGETVSDGKTPAMRIKARITGRNVGACTAPPANDGDNGVIGDGK